MAGKISPPSESSIPEPRSPWRRRIILGSLVAMVIAAAVVLPPFLNINRYQRQITALVSRSVGRPVHLSGVELRLLPRPGFVLTNLSVGEDPEFGVEPILSAQTVIASIRLSTLFTGQVQIDRIDLDEASLNLVQSARGRWNLESLMRGHLAEGLNRTAPTSAPSPAFSRRPAAFPYLEATNSRVNLKKGLEKVPYALIGGELSFWQESPGVWRLRLRAQPARTDMEMSTADAGELRLEATVQMLPGHELREMPLRLQAEWREAQLGQLSRLLLGSDEGWRGDLTADLNVQGTPDAAQTRARLRATGVRRAEFVPAVPLDFDANCTFRYEHAKRAVRGLACDTAIGDGKLHLTGDLPADSGQPQATLAVDQLPLQAGLDMLRTLRSGFAPGVDAEGKVDGTISLSPQTPLPAPSRKPAHSRQASALLPPAANPALQGLLTISGGRLHGGSLAQPLALPKITLTPSQLPDPDQPSATIPALTTRFAVALGPFPAPSRSAAGEPAKASSKDDASAAGNAPSESGGSDDAAPPPSGVPQPAARSQELSLRLTLAASGYQLALGGSATPARLRELAYAFGLPRTPAADSLSDGTADLDLTASGPWVTSLDLPLTVEPAPTATSTTPESPHPVSPSPVSPSPVFPNRDQLSGSIQLHHAMWSAPYLARPVEIPEAAVALAGTSASMTGAFVYGPLRGSATIPDLLCNAAPCHPKLELKLGAVDAGVIEAALLGAPEKKTMLSPLIDRLRRSDHPKWPQAAVDVQADSLVLGPLTLRKPLLQLKLAESEITLESWQASLLGGAAQGSGSSAWTGSTLHYTLTGDFHGLSGSALGALTASQPAPPAASPGGESNPIPAAASAWAGGPVDGSGSLELSGLTDKDLATSASGKLHFHWLRGAIPVASAPKAPARPLRFDDWSGDAAVASGKLELGSNTLRQGRQTTSVSGSIPFAGPPSLTVPASLNVPAPAKPATAPHPAQ